MPVLAGTVERSGQLGEKTTGRTVALYPESDCGKAVLAIARHAVAAVGVHLEAGPVIPVTDRSLVDELLKEAAGTGDGVIDLGVIDAALPREQQGKVTRQPGLVQGAVSGQATMQFATVLAGPGEAMAPSTAAALSHRRLDGIFADSGQDVLVPRGKKVFRQQEVVKTGAPGLLAPDLDTDLELGAGPLLVVQVLAHQGEVLLLPGGQQSERGGPETPHVLALHDHLEGIL